MQEFCSYWGVPSFQSLEALLRILPKDGLILNLTSPEAHYEVTYECLKQGAHVYSEKPLAMRFEEARELTALACKHGVLLGGAPCSYLSMTAQTVGAAVRQNVAGPVRLIYAELDDGYIPQAPVEKWKSESGAQWPYENEVRTGCTIEHAGYVLTWLISIFGTIDTITAFSASTVDKELDPVATAPDVSVGVLQFEAGPVVRITNSIVAPHNHRILMVGDKGILEVDDSWANNAQVKYRRRIRIRRRLMEFPLPKRLRLSSKPGGLQAKRYGSASMDFFLGPVELLETISGSQINRVSSDIALHTTEATLFLQNAGKISTTYKMQSRCDPLQPLDWAQSLR
ncbi:MAG: Gfo/Idh/MocA family oxidoreductase [Pseudomonadota bacterium]